MRQLLPEEGPGVSHLFHGTCNGSLYVHVAIRVCERLGFVYADENYCFIDGRSHNCYMYARYFASAVVNGKKHNFSNSRKARMGVLLPNLVPY